MQEGFESHSPRSTLVVYTWIIKLTVVCCDQSNNITAYAQPNASSVSQEILLNQLLNNSLVFLNKTNIVGKLVPLNETESVTSPNATSLLLPFLLRNYSNVTNNQTAFHTYS